MAELNPAEVLTDLKKSFHEFKAENDKGRAADKAVLAKIETDVAKFDSLHAKFVEQEAKSKAANESLERLEKLFNRMQLGKPGEKEPSIREKKRAAMIAYARFGLDPARWEQAEAERKSGLNWAVKENLESVPFEVKTLTNSDDTAGGYLAPPEFVAEITKAAVLVSPMRSLVKVRNTMQKEIRIPKRTQTAAARWTGETQVRTESQNMAYGMDTIPAQELTAEVYVSFADLEDSAFDIEAELGAEFAEQFAVSEGAAVVGGSGLGKPYGILDSSQSIPTTNSGTSGSIADANGVADGIITLFHTVKTAYAQNGRWLLNRLTMGSVRKLKDTQKRYLWEPSPALGMPSTILGAPYTEVPDMPNEAAAAKAMAFGDWKRCYTLVDRISLSILRDPYTQASNGAIKFVARRRLGGKVVLAEAANILVCS